MTKKAALLKKPMTKKEELQQMVIDYEKAVKELEKGLVEFALEHNLPLYLGEYGVDGRSLVLEDRKHPYYEGYETDRVRGEWLYSSETC